MYQNSTTVKIGKETYSLHYPNVGEQLEIENLKNVLTKGKYAELAQVGSKTSVQLLDFVDAFSYLNVLCKKAKVDFGLQIENFEKIDVKTQRALSRVFIKFYNEFIVKVEQEINSVLALEEEDLDDETETTNVAATGKTGL